MKEREKKFNQFKAEGCPRGASGSHRERAAGSGEARAAHRTRSQKIKQNRGPRARLYGEEIVREPEILLQEFFLFS